MAREKSATVVISDGLGVLLTRAFEEALPKELILSSSFPSTKVAAGVRWRLCLEPQLALAYKRHGWREGIIFLVDRDTFRGLALPVGPKDGVLFHDIASSRLAPAVKAALAGLTVFPTGVVPQAARAAPLLGGFDRLDAVDHSVMTQLSDGRTDREISRALHMPIQQVRQRLLRILRALRSPNRTRAAVIIHCRLRPFLDAPDGGRNFAPV